MKKAILFFAMIFIYEVSTAQERLSSCPFIAGDTFRAAADHIIDQDSPPFNPSAVKPGDVIFVKTDYVPHFFADMHAQIKVEYILITHNADLSPIYLKAIDHPWAGYDYSRYLDDPQLLVWFAQNIDYVHPKLKPLPIGLANQYNFHGRIEFFFNAMQEIPAFEGRAQKIYLNFTVSSNEKERRSALDFFATKTYASFMHPKAPQVYLQEIKQFKYVLCPEGNGIDCHRPWEALLMGCVPILKHSMIDDLFEDLPVILVHEWAQVTEDLLNRYEQARVGKTYKMEKALADYWIALIRSYKRHAL